MTGPTHRDIRYGPHERNVFDLYLTDAERPAPLYVFIHGGGFRGGDKSGLPAGRPRGALPPGAG